MRQFLKNFLKNPIFVGLIAASLWACGATGPGGTVPGGGALDQVVSGGGVVPGPGPGPGGGGSAATGDTITSKVDPGCAGGGCLGPLVATRAYYGTTKPTDLLYPSLAPPAPPGPPPGSPFGANRLMLNDKFKTFSLSFLIQAAFTVDKEDKPVFYSEIADHYARIIVTRDGRHLYQDYLMNGVVSEGSNVGYKEVPFLAGDKITLYFYRNLEIKKVVTDPSTGLEENILVPIPPPFANTVSLKPFPTDQPTAYSDFINDKDHVYDLGTIDIMMMTILDPTLPPSGLDTLAIDTGK